MAPAVSVRSLGIRYNLRLTRKNTVRETFKNLARRSGGPTHFWALRDVTFQLDHGESLAVIGPNGAGKSTLLQVLARILEPTEGNIDVNGRISSLLTLGAGFDPDLSGQTTSCSQGRSWAWTTMTCPPPARDHRVRRHRPVHRAPIKTYSSGMNARLGFSVATAVEPDVLLLDEVLGTGDATFRSKSHSASRS